MKEGQHIIAVEAISLAQSLPYSLMQIVCASVESCDLSDWPRSRHQVISGIAHAHYRSLVGNFLDCWKAQASDLSCAIVATALRTAVQAERVHRDDQLVELVWTGPDIGVVPFRRTEQAILQVLDSATRRITLVSYAVYRIPRICDALVRAALRGVKINVILETPNRIEGKTEYNTIQALGDQVGAVSTVYYWPETQRAQDNGGKHGILHVKCAVADSRWLFLSSANLTEYAFTVNMELGLLITGGPQPCQVEEQFDRLIQTGVLENV